MVPVNPPSQTTMHPGRKCEGLGEKSKWLPRYAIPCPVKGHSLIITRGVAQCSECMALFYEAPCFSFEPRQSKTNSAALTSEPFLAGGASYISYKHILNMGDRIIPNRGTGYLDKSPRGGYIILKKLTRNDLAMGVPLLGWHLY